jgi:hypothetical protein
MYVVVILLVFCYIVLVMANCLVDYAMFHVLLCVVFHVVLFPGIVSNFSRFCETSGLNKLLTLDTIGEWWLNLRSPTGILFAVLFSIVILMWASLV